MRRLRSPAVSPPCVARIARIACVALVAIAAAACAGGTATSSGIENRPAPVSTERIQVGSSRAEPLDLTNDAREGIAFLLEGPVDSTWVALQRAYDALHIPITDMSTTQHLVGNAHLELRGWLGKRPLARYLDCGRSPTGQPNADSPAFRVTLSISSTLTPESETSSLVRTRLQAQAQAEAQSTAPVRCRTTGLLEQEIAKRAGNGVPIRGG